MPLDMALEAPLTRPSQHPDSTPHLVHAELSGSSGLGFLKLIPPVGSLCYVQLFPAFGIPFRCHPLSPHLGRYSQIPWETSSNTTIIQNSHDLSTCLSTDGEHLGPRSSSFHFDTPTGLVQCLVHRRLSVNVCGIKIITQLLPIESLQRSRHLQSPS